MAVILLPEQAGTVLDNSADAIAFFAPLLEDLACEVLCVAHVDPAGALLGLSEAIVGDRDGVDLPIRGIVRDAVLLDASGVILAHNHPSGDPTPSRADLGATRRLGMALRALDIRIVDHLVCGGGHWRSFRALGLL